MLNNDDVHLVQKCLNGDSHAFERLVEKYQQPIYNVVYRMCHNLDDARDVTQSVFLRAYDKLKTYKPQFKFFSWIYRIAINETLNHMEKNKAMDNLSDTSIVGTCNPEDFYEQLELSDHIQEALLQVDSKYRALIILKHFQNCSYEQISQIMDLPERTVKSRLYMARQQLAEILIKRGLQ